MERRAKTVRMPPERQEHQERLKGLFWFENKKRFFAFGLLGGLGVLVAILLF